MTCALCTSPASRVCAGCGKVYCTTCAGKVVPEIGKRKCPAAGCPAYLARMRAIASAAAPARSSPAAPPVPAAAPPRAEPEVSADFLLSLGVTGPLYEAVQRFAQADAAERSLRKGT